MPDPAIDKDIESQPMLSPQRNQRLDPLWSCRIQILTFDSNFGTHDQESIDQIEMQGLRIQAIPQSNYQSRP